MSNRNEHMRLEFVEKTGGIPNTSLSSESLKKMREGAEREFGDHKAARANRKREERALLEKRYGDPGEFMAYQVARSATRVNDGVGTQADREFLRKQQFPNGPYDIQLVSRSDGFHVNGQFEPQEYQMPESERTIYPDQLS